MIYWNLVPSGMNISNVHIKIYSDERFNDTLPVWGYGKYGATAYVYDGYIEMNSEGMLNSNEYLTILVKFDKGTFTTQNIISNNFDYYHNIAEEGATAYKEENSFGFFRGISWLFSIIYQLFRNAIRLRYSLGDSSVMRFIKREK